MVVLEAASRTLLGIREGAKLVLSPFYWSVTWLLNQILGSFTLYVGIGHEEPPDSDVSEDWPPVVATALMLFFILAIVIFSLEWRLAPDPLRYTPEDLELPNDAPSESMKAEDGRSPKIELCNQ